MLPVIGFSMSRIWDSDGIAIAATGMLIVFLALSLITIFIASLPSMLAQLASILPETEDRQARPDPSQSTIPDDEAVLAAIGFVLHTEIHKRVEPPGK